MTVCYISQDAVNYVLFVSMICNEHSLFYAYDCTDYYTIVFKPPRVVYALWLWYLVLNLSWNGFLCLYTVWWLLILCTWTIFVSNWFFGDSSCYICIPLNFFDMASFHSVLAYLQLLILQSAPGITPFCLTYTKYNIYLYLAMQQFHGWVFRDFLGCNMNRLKDVKRVSIFSYILSDIYL